MRGTDGEKERGNGKQRVKLGDEEIHCKLENRRSKMASINLDEKS